MINKGFSKSILKWYSIHKRDLPWRLTRDPYIIWLSEIILQQTRVNQGLPYFLKFIEAFPTVQDLANSDEQQVLRLWQGLGYYSRGRNLHKCALVVANEYQGKFPQDYEDLQKLPGIGKYTAAAIASFAFKKKVPVVDGNVYRLLSRYFGIDTPINSNKAFNEFFTVAQTLIDDDFPDHFNQAIMELGATVCKPGMPNCTDCPINSDCYARIKRLQLKYPKKQAKKESQTVLLNYAVYRQGDKIWMSKREKGIWRGLYEFYLMEEKVISRDQIPTFAQEDYPEYGTRKVYTHKLSHKDLRVSFNFKDLSKVDKALIKRTNGRFYTLKEVLELPKPILIDNYLKEVIF